MISEREKMNYVSETAKQRAEKLLKQMTVLEKVGQLNQKLYGFQIYQVKDNDIIFDDTFKNEVEKYSGLGILYGLYRADPWSEKNYTNGLYGKLAIKAYNKMQKYVLDNSRLKIPAMMSSECPHGHQALDSYLLTVNLAMGSSFNKKLVHDAYTVCAKELKQMGVHLALISLLDVARDPRWGRTEECFSEDPWLCSQMAGEVVQAVQNEGVNVVAKHFAAQGEGTGGVNASAARIGERELREIHLPAMKECCKHNVKGVMAAYNEIDGVYCHANKKLLTDILRSEMGFDGIVMADGCALDRLDTMTGDNVLSGAIALKAGVDVGLWDTAYGNLDKAIEKGYISIEELDKAVLRILEMKFEMGLFDNPFIDEDKELESFDFEKYPEALNLARETVILLKNNNILPIKQDIKKIAVIGPNADEIYNQLGDYTPPVNEKKCKTILAGVKDIADKHNIDVKFAQGSLLTDVNESMINEAVNVANESDIVFLVLGGSSSRFGKVSFDTNGAAVSENGVSMDCGEGVDASEIELPYAQRKLAQAILNTGKKVITIVNGGRPYAMGDIAEKSDAIIYSFYSGMLGGKAIAEVIFGQVNPSGRLPISIPRSSGQIPAYYNFKNSYQGIHYYDKNDGAEFTFGDGLSYSKFEYTNVTINNTISLDELKNTGVNVKATVTNVSDFDGYTVPLVYISGLQGSVVRRVKELKGMDKVWLKSGEKKDIVINLPYDAFCVWDMQMNFKTEAGKVKITLEEMGETVWFDTIEIKA